MILEKKVTTIELSKRMVELGWAFETERYWNVDTAYKKPRLVKKPEGDWAEFNIIKHCIPAPDAIEIGERLPRAIAFKDKAILKRLSYSNVSKPEAESWYGCGAWGTLSIDCILYSLSGTHADKDRWNINYLTCSTRKLLIHNEQGKTEAEARGKMWCYLKGKGLL